MRAFAAILAAFLLGACITPAIGSGPTGGGGGGGAPSGPAGGALSGNYPNPTIATNGTQQLASVGLGGAAGASNTLKFYGSTSGSTLIQAAAVTTQTITYTLPSGDGNAGDLLSDTGSGALAWRTLQAGSGITINRSGSTITLSSTGGGGGSVSWPLTVPNGTSSPQFVGPTNAGLVVSSPDVNSGTSQDVTIKSGEGGSSGSTGNVHIATGVNGDGGTQGAVYVDADCRFGGQLYGPAGSDTFINLAAGYGFQVLGSNFAGGVNGFTFTAAASTAGNNPGGSMSFTTGAGHGTQRGGNLTFTCGAAGATGTGAGITFNAGGTTSGTSGSITFKTCANNSTTEVTRLTIDSTGKATLGAAGAGSLDLSGGDGTSNLGSFTSANVAIGRLQFASTGQAGSTTATLGAACPGATAAPAAWIKVKDSNGVDAFIPIWQ